MKNFFLVIKLNILVIFFLSNIGNIHAGSLTKAISDLDIETVKNNLSDKKLTKEHQQKLFSFAKQVEKKYGDQLIGQAKPNIIGGKPLISILTILSLGVIANFIYGATSLIEQEYCTRKSQRLEEEKLEEIKSEIKYSALIGFPLLLYCLKKWRDLKIQKCFLDFEKAVQIKNLIKNCPVINPVIIDEPKLEATHGETTTIN